MDEGLLSMSILNKVLLEFELTSRVSERKRRQHKLDYVDMKLLKTPALYIFESSRILIIFPPLHSLIYLIPYINWFDIPILIISRMWVVNRKIYMIFHYKHSCSDGTHILFSFADICHILAHKQQFYKNYK